MDRVAGFIVNKGGIYYSDVLTPEARQVPGLFFVGGKDLQSRQDAIRRLFTINQQAGAAWSLIEEPAEAHTIGKSRQIARGFFADLMARHPSASPATTRTGPPAHRSAQFGKSPDRPNS